MTKFRNNLKLSILDLATMAENENAADAFKHSRELAVLAEALGYERFWFAEHHNMDGIASSATALLIGHIAGVTKSIRVGSGGIMLPNHSALVIAEQFGTLESLYPGRIDLGLGRAPGTDQATMRALRRQLEGEDFETQLQDLMSYFDPAPGQYLRAVPGSGLNIPIWLLGSSLFSARLAAKRGLPYAFAGHFAPELMQEAVELYRAQFVPSPDLARPYVMIGVQVIAAPTDEEAEFLMTSLYQRFLALIRNQSFKKKAPVESMDGIWSQLESFHIKNKLASAVRGSAQSVASGLLSLAQRTGADELMIASDPYDHQHRLRSFEIIANALRA